MCRKYKREREKDEKIACKATEKASDELLRINFQIQNGSENSLQLNSSMDLGLELP